MIINDSKQPFNFLFDSGAGITVIDKKTANELKLKISGTSKVGTSGKTIETRESTPNELKFNESFKIEDISLFIMDLAHISEYLKFNVDGIVGFDLLSKTIVETNIDSMEMRFFKKGNYIGNTNHLNLIDLESNHFGLPIEIKPKGSKNKLKLIVKIDTGAGNHLTLHNNFVNNNNLINKNTKYKTRKGFGADSTMTSNIRSKISLARFASKEWKNVPVVFEVDPLNQNSERIAGGLIGQEMLLEFNITYNLADKIIYLEER